MNLGSERGKTRRIARAISIRQPYAEQILRGAKTRECRSVSTNIRERVYFYASERPGDWFDYDLLGFEVGDLPRGKLVGTVDVVGCEPEPRTGRYAYLLDNPRASVGRLSRPTSPSRFGFGPSRRQLSGTYFRK